MPIKSRTEVVAEEFQEQEVIRYLSEGLNLPQIGKLTGLHVTKLRTIEDKWLAEQHARHAELFELMSLRNIVRMETMYGEVAKLFYQQMRGEVDGESSFPAFDKALADTMLKIMKEEREYMKERRDAVGSSTDNSHTTNVNLTFTASDPMYSIANGNVIAEKEEDWFNADDVDLDSIYGMEDADYEEISDDLPEDPTERKLLMLAKQLGVNLDKADEDGD